MNVVPQNDDIVAFRLHEQEKFQTMQHVKWAENEAESDPESCCPEGRSQMRHSSTTWLCTRQVRIARRRNDRLETGILVYIWQRRDLSSEPIEFEPAI